MHRLNARTDFPWHYLEDTTYENASKKSIKTAFAHLLLGNDGHRSLGLINLQSFGRVL